MNEFDALIIGGGPAGYTAALNLAKQNRRALIIEKDRVGGTCLHRGCIPMKTFLRESNLESAIARKNSVIETLYRGLKSQLKSAGVEIFHGEGVIQEARDNFFRVNDFTAPNLIIATGSRDRKIDLDGAIYSSEFFEVDHWSKNVTVIGGGVMGIEFATFLNRIGCSVTILEMADRILGRSLDNDVRSIVLKNLEESRIEIVTSARAMEFEDSTLIFERGGSIDEIACDQIVCSIGREPMKIDIDSNLSGLYFAGDVRDEIMLAHSAFHDAEIVADKICEVKNSTEDFAIPSVIFSNPEVASVGLTESECRQRNLNFRISKLPMSFSSRFVIDNSHSGNLIKLIIDSNGFILGGQIIGNGSSELIFTIADFINSRQNVSEIQRKIFPHPSLVEILKFAVE
ncbi:MAG: NAD(P)/FAD-dependent oxidoreductase [Selenomonadaceae bacterium]|nr:NAD(P)/FAD-dependent oxidoreductase [Selenomonadaceae bacterium]